MSVFIKYFIPLMVATALISSCSKDEPSASGSHELSFAVQMAEETKAAGQYTPSDLNSLTQFKVFGYDGTEKFLDNKEVNKSGSVWRLNDKPTVWEDDHTMTFFASANMPSWASLSSSSSSSASLSVSSIPSSAASQWDPLVGYYSGKGEKGKATLTFNHPFTAVSFKTGSLGEPAYVSSINSVQLSGVYNGGTATVSKGSTQLTYSWSTSATTSVSGSFSGTQSAQPFLLIPQKLTAANISITVSVSLVGGGSRTFTISLNAGEWKSGIHYTYTLDYLPYFGIDGTLKATLTDWVYIKSDSGKNFFDANFDKA